MFGGWGISIDGLTLALVADLGDGETLWLKADEETRGLFEAAGCRQFTYAMKGVPRSMNYFAATDEAMESPQLMAPWARQALGSALKARAKLPPVRAGSKPGTAPARPTTPKASRTTAPPAKPSARRKSTKG